MFPELFQKFFVYDKGQDVSAEALMKSVEFPGNPTSEEARGIAMFKDFVNSSSKEG